MQLVERHITVKDEQLAHLCWLSKNLYNAANYILRQSFFASGTLPKEYELTGELAKNNQVDYRALPAQTSQQVIKLLYKNWKAFFAATKEYGKHPEKFLGKPKLPKYKEKDGKNIVVFTNQQCSLKDGYIHFPQAATVAPLKTKVADFQQVRIIPQATCIVFEVVYNVKDTETLADNDRYLSLDLGLNNLATSFNNVGLEPFIINGRPLKSVNQYYNKVKAEQQAGEQSTHKITLWRNNRVHDYLHKTSRFIVNYALKHSLNTIIVGHNEHWKQEIHLGKRTNQSFVSIPHAKLIGQLEYKCKLAGLRLIQTEESYTSKVDHLANEEMKHQVSYWGKRIKRGLFRSSTRQTVNADWNGALGIFRKVARKETFNEFRARSGQVLSPCKVSFK